MLRIFYQLDAWLAFDGASYCDGDADLQTLVDRLTAAGWQYARDEGVGGYVFVR